MKQFAVIGNPITHSKSPEIHQAFAAQFDIDLSYTRLLANEGKFAPMATGFFERGTGANVTVPFKTDALRFADTLSKAAEIAGAVNTLSRQSGQIHGDNTDGVGLVNDIKNNHHYTLKDKKVLIIGAGGAARGAIYPIAQESPNSITVANRTHQNAVTLAEHFADHTNIDAATLDDLNTAFDLIINATSASLSGNALSLPSEIFKSDMLAYDMMYGSEPTPFMQLATQHQAIAVDGLGMLVEQAAQSFSIWHGVFPETQHVISHMRSQL